MTSDKWLVVSYRAISILGILIFLDQLTKWLAFRFEPFGLTGILYLAHFKNENFAFSFILPITVMYALYFVGLLNILLYLWKKSEDLSNLEKLAWLFVISGAFSNVGERIITGHVKDFVGILNGVFNLADGYILAGIILLLIANFKLKSWKA